MVSLNKPYPFKLFKGCLPHNLLSLLLNTLSQMFRMVPQDVFSVALLNTPIRIGLCHRDIKILHNSSYVKSSWWDPV